MGYLVLRFENANLIRSVSISKKTKKRTGTKQNHLLIHGGELTDNTNIEKVLDATGHDWNNPIPYTTLSNILHCLCGEIPVPSKKRSLFKRNPVYDEIAKNSYVKYDVKPIFNDKGYIINDEIYQTAKWAYDSNMTYTSFFKLFDGTTKEISGHYNWNNIKKNITYGSDFEDLVDLIEEIIGIKPLSLSVPQVVYEMSKYYNDDTFKEKTDRFIEERKKMVNGKKRILSCFYNLFFNKIGTGSNTDLKTSNTPLALNNGIGGKLSLSGEIICEITDEIASKIKQNKGVANLLEFGLIYVVGYEKYEPVPNYKEKYEKIH